MDVSTINDINQLKAMAYDEIANKEQAERNLRVINERIEAVFLEQSTPAETPPAAPPASASDAIVGLAASTDNPSSLIGDSAGA